MNEDPLTVTLTQISQLVATLNKKNLQQSSRQINQLVKEFGFEADRHYLRCLFSAIDFGDAAQVSKSSVQAKLLNTELSTLITKPNFVSHICFAFDHSFESQKSLKPNAHLFANLTKALNLTSVKEVVLAHSLTHSEHPDLRHLATDYLRASLLKLIQSHIEVESPAGNSDSGLHDVTPELLQLLLSLLVHERYEELGLPKSVYDKFIGQLCHDFPRDHVPLVLAPLLYADEETEVGVDVVAANTQSILQSSPIMDTSWSKLVMEIGYSFTASVDECKNHLVKISGREIKATDVAKIVGVMCQTHTGLSESSINLPTPATFWPEGGNKDASATPNKGAPGPNGGASASASGAGEQPITWKPEVLVQALKEVAPGLKWEDVCIALDHPEFALKDRQGLVMLLSIIRLGYQSPVHTQVLTPQSLYRHWDNSGGQLSLFYQMLKNPDVISFADYIVKPVITDPLKTPPELDNKEVAAWKSLHLIEVLLHIADNGFYTKVTEIFKIPIQLCPDLFFFALLQINTPASLIVLRHELFVRLMPIFLGNHPNSSTVIQHAWNMTSLKPVVLNSIIEWYYRGENDQARLSRILDVAQDLKALSSLLTVQAFPFSIDLACLASRRGYLKLEKWWNDQVREHRDQQFIRATVNFLQRKCPQPIGGKIPDDQLPKAAQLPPETMTTLITCLQSCIGNVSPDVHEMIVALSTHCNLLLNSSRQQQQQLPPPAVLRAAVPPPPQGQQPPQQMRALESQLHAANLGGQFLGNQNVDAFTSAMSGLNLGGANNNFNFNMLSNIVSTPVSPSRLLNNAQGAPSHSPFSVMAAAAANQSMNLGGSVAANRIQPTPLTGDKLLPNQNVMFPEIAGNIPKEIEDEANSYFQRIYNHPPHPTLSIEEVLDMLQRFKESQNRREHGVYQCMLRNLFEEYRFFPNYPDKELQITAQLFGGMVDRKLVVEFVELGMALRFVLDALKKPESSKMYFFGITALDRFKTKLHLYPKYCEYVRGIPHFDQFPPHLIEYLEYGVNAQEPPTKPQGSLMPQMLASTTSNALYNRSNSVTSNLSMTGGGASKATSSAATASGAAGASSVSRVKSIASATNIDTLLVANQDREEKITAPPDAIQDKSAFIFNNLSQLNLAQKCEEIKEIMTKEYWSWLAQYLVLKRASIEFNFHTLYSNFLDVLKIPEINRMVTRETFRNIRVLLRSDKSIANFSDRSLLKNLGHWLGMMTLGRSRPILQLDIDLKSLLAEAYLKGQQELLYIVPFVAKVLESCAKSRVFKLPNPWTMAIMNVLAELHQEPDLKLNLKFEIEVLCKNFNIDVSDLKPACYLKEAEKYVVEFQLSADKQLKDVILQSPIQQQMQSNATPSLLGAGNMNLLAATARGDDVSAMVNATVSPSPGLDGVGGGAMVTGPPEPKFSYMSINVGNLSSIGQLMTIAPNMPMFHAQPHLKSIIRVAIERTIGEWLSPVVDRSVKIALTTCEQIIRKDFALDMEEMHMRTAAHYMVRNLTAGMAMITCREQLSQALIGNIKNALLSSLTPQQKELAETAALQLAADNMELACAFIQKTAIERAVQDIDKRLGTDYELRKHARMEGRTILDQETYTYQCERMPEQIRLTGNITKHQFAVYEEFVKNIPGFMPIGANEVGMFFPKQQPPQAQQQQQQQPPVQQQQTPEMFNQLGMTAAVSAAAPVMSTVQVPSPYPTGNFLHTPEEMLVMYEELMAKMDAFIVSVVTIPALQVQLKNIHTLYDILRRNRDNTNAITLQTKAVEFLLEGYVNLPEHVEHIKMYRDILLRQLRILQDSYDVVTTKAVFECREEIRYNLEAIDVLITSNFINMDPFDMMMSRAMENGNNYLAVNFGMKLVQRYLIDRSFPLVSDKDLANTVEMLTRIAVHPAAPEGLVHLMEILRLNQEQNLLSSMGNVTAAGQIPGMLPVRGGAGLVHDDASLQQKIEYLLKDWVTIFHRQSRDPSKAVNVFLNKLSVYGVELFKFLQHATKICIDLSYRQLSDQSTLPGIAKIKIFHWIDPYVRLITLLMKLGGSDSQTKINLLNKVLYIIAEALLKDHEKQGVGFQQVGFHRMLIMLFLELSAPDPVLESISLNVVAMFAHTFHLIRPMMAPGFCYAWLELISHRVFLNRCLAVMGQQKGWGIYSQLLLDLFNYLAPFLRNAELAKPVHLMYKGTLRILLVLLHDFPEFLCDYHFSFCDVIPPNCIQMRNLILSAFPENMRMPDPFTPNLKVDMLPETANPPRILTNFAENITPIQFRQSLDSYLKTRAPVTFLSELRGCLQISNEPGSRYNIPLMNALVLYVGTQAIAHIRSKNLAPNMNTIVHSAHMDIFQNLSVDLENEGRYLFLNAIANQLRYPNSLTNYFSCVLLYLFVEANSEAIQEQITRVLVERLIVNRPHPWGLLITFIELIKNPVYKFWDHEFVHCAPEMTGLFESVARFCTTANNNSQQQLGNFETEGGMQECN